MWSDNNVGADAELVFCDFIRDIRTKKDLELKEIDSIDYKIRDYEREIDHLMDRISDCNAIIESLKTQEVRHRDRIKLLDEAAMQFHRVRWKHKGYID